jgi:plasmid stabilization system protein ParE
MRVSFLEAADAEVDAAMAWYAERSLLAASGFLHELSKTINHIVDAPHRYPKAEHSTRKIRFDRFPYSIYYRITDDAIVVIAVARGKRRPRYWAGRSPAG